VYARLTLSVRVSVVSCALVFVLPSLYIGLDPVLPLEAMARGTALKRPAIPEV